MEIVANPQEQPGMGMKDTYSVSIRDCISTINQGCSIITFFDNNLAVR